MSHPAVIDLERCKPPKKTRTRVPFHNRKLSPIFARVADTVAVLALVFTVWAVTRFTTARVLAPALPGDRVTTVVEQLDAAGHVVAQWTASGEPRSVAAGVCAFETLDGQRLFLSGPWRVVTSRQH